MNKNHAKQVIKNRLEEYLLSITSKVGEKYICPLCGSGTKTNKTPAGQLNKDGQTFHCFSCGFHGDIFTLIGAKEQITDVAEQFNRAYQIFGFYTDGNKKSSEKRGYFKKAASDSSFFSDNDKEIAKIRNGSDFGKQNETSLTDYTLYFKECHARAGETEYFSFRGLTKTTIDSFMLGFDPEWRSPKAIKNGKNPPASPRIIIPTSEYSYLARATYENEKKFKAVKEGKSEIFNLEAMYKYATVFIVEGEIDALSVIEAGGQAIALGSTANKNKFLSIIGENKPMALLILSLDNDSAGKKTQAELAQALRTLKIAFLEANISAGYDDPNQHLTSDSGAFRSVIQQDYLQIYKNEAQAEQNSYKRKAAGCVINTFFEEIERTSVMIPTGFKEFDKILDGGLYEGLYIIGAVSSLGKTTFALQMGDQIAQQGYDVLCFSLEMSKHELIAKSISRLTFLSGNAQKAKSVRDITSKSKYEGFSQVEKDLIHQSAERYAEYGKNVYIFEGIGDIGANEIKSTLQEHISATGKTPVIIIDYLQILASDVRGTDKQNTDRSVLELKRLSRDFKMPILAISSFNRENYKTEVSMLAFKESGAIEYSSDVLLGLQFKGAGPTLNDTEARKKDPRQIELKVLKNRNGRVGDTIEFAYYPQFNFFKEIESDGGNTKRNTRKV